MVRFLQAITLTEGIDLEKTMKRFPPEAVKQRVKAVVLDRRYMEDMMMEVGIETRRKYREFDDLPEQQVISMAWVRKNDRMPALWCFETIIEFMEEADPTTKKAYVFDLFRIWMGDKDFLIEDIGKVGEELAVIVDARRTGLLKRLTPQQLQERRGQRIAQFIENGENLRYITVARDIGWIAEDINFWIDTDPSIQASRAEQARQEEEVFLRTSSAKILLNNERFKLVLLITEEAAKFYGRSTRWCTASQKMNQFNRYMQQNFMFVIFDRVHNTKSQIAVPRRIEFLDTELSELKKKAKIYRLENKVRKEWVNDEFIRLQRYMAQITEFRDEQDDSIDLSTLDPQIIDAIDAHVKNFRQVLITTYGTAKLGYPAEMGYRPV